MKDRNYFDYHRIYCDVNDIIGEAEALLRSKSPLNHIWEIYQRVLEFENISTELKNHLNDLSSDISDYNSVGYSQNLLNISDGISLLDVCNGTYNQIITNLKLARQIAVRSSNGTILDFERDMINNQFKDLLNEINRLALNTEWNSIKLLDGSYQIEPLIFQIGVKNSNLDRIYLNLIDISPFNLGLYYDNNYLEDSNYAIDFTCLSTQDKSNLALDKIDDAIEIVNYEKTNISSTINKLKSANININNKLNIQLTNLIEILNKIAEYCKCKGEYHYSNSNKKDIPEWLT